MIEKNKISKGRMKGRMLESGASLRGCLCMGEFPVHSLGTAMYNLQLLRAEALDLCRAHFLPALSHPAVGSVLYRHSGPISLPLQRRTTLQADNRTIVWDYSKEMGC